MACVKRPGPKPGARGRWLEKLLRDLRFNRS